MKKKGMAIGIAIFIIFIVFVLYISIRHNLFLKVGNKITSLKEMYESSEEYLYRHENLHLCDSIPSLTDEQNAWYTNYHFISHSGGGIDGKFYTNSKQAWDLSYERGNRLFDADLAFTSDNILVLRHRWDDNLEQNIPMLESNTRSIDDNGQMRYLESSSTKMDYSTFINTKIYKKYDAMSCIDMLNFMEKHPDVYVMCDMKDDLYASYKWLVEVAVETGLEDVLDRIVVSIYHYENLETINNIYHFDNVMLRQFTSYPHRYIDIIRFCEANNVHAVNVSASFINDEGITQLANHNIHIYVAVCDYISDMQVYSNLGIDGAVTNYLYEDDWKYISDPSRIKEAEAK